MELERLKDLCVDFGFELYVLGDKYVINSGNDKWGIDMFAVQNNHCVFVLHHLGSLGKMRWHRQKKEKMPLYDIFKYIKAHEKKSFRPGKTSIFAN